MDAVVEQEKVNDKKTLKRTLKKKEETFLPWYISIVQHMTMW